MKKLLVLLLMLCLCVCAVHAEGGKEYTLFAVEAQGYTVVPEALGITSVLTLPGEGQGRMTFNEDSIAITRWTLEGETFFLEMADGSAAGGVFRDGVIQLDLYGNGAIVLDYAAPGADTSAYSVLSVEEFIAQRAADQAARIPASNLYALSQSLDSAAGLRLAYNVHQDYMDADQSYAVQGRGGLYYSLRVTRVSGLENKAAVLFREGTAYNLDPDAKTALKVTSTNIQAVNQDALLLDDLYSAIVGNAERTDFTVEKRAVDGTEYAVEVFPARADYESVYAFYFDGEGRLAYCEEKHPDTAGIQLGVSFYTVEAMDGAVEDALFELTGYTVTE